MSDSIAASNAASSGSFSAADAASDQPVVIRSASDITQLVNRGAAKLSDARVVIAIALGGVFLDAYDLGALAFGMKILPASSGYLLPAQDLWRRRSPSGRLSGRCWEAI